VGNESTYAGVAALVDVTGAAGVELGVWVAGQMVVYAATVTVLTMVLWAGQEVTVAEQLVTVTRMVVYTTEVTRSWAAEEVVLWFAEAMPAKTAAMNATEYFMLVKVTTVIFLLKGVIETAGAASTGYIDYGRKQKKKVRNLGFRADTYPRTYQAHTCGSRALVPRSLSLRKIEFVIDLMVNW